MASLSASSLIIFIAAVAIAASVSGVMIDSVSEISQSITTHGDGLQKELDTEISIISDPESNSTYDADNGTVQVLVKNTGSRSLSTDEDRIDVLVDGRYVVSDTYSSEVISGERTWRIGAVLELTIDLDTPLGEKKHRVTVIINGDRETLQFYI